MPAQRSSTARVFREWSAPASAARREDAIAATAFGPYCRALGASNISAMDGAERAAPHSSTTEEGVRAQAGTPTVHHTRPSASAQTASAQFARCAGACGGSWSHWSGDEGECPCRPLVWRTGSRRPRRAVRLPEGLGPHVAGRSEPVGLDRLEALTKRAVRMAEAAALTPWRTAASLAQT